MLAERKVRQGRETGNGLAGVKGSQGGGEPSALEEVTRQAEAEVCSAWGRMRGEGPAEAPGGEWGGPGPRCSDPSAHAE